MTHKNPMQSLQEAFADDTARWDLVESHAHHMWDALSQTPPLLESQGVDALRDYGEQMMEHLVDIASGFFGTDHAMVEKCMAEAAKARAVKKEKGAAFDTLVKEFQKRGDVEDPEALAAWIGRKNGKIK